MKVQKKEKFFIKNTSKLVLNFGKGLPVMKPGEIIEITGYEKLSGFKKLEENGNIKFVENPKNVKTIDDDNTDEKKKTSSNDDEEKEEKTDAKTEEENEEEEEETL